MDAAHAENARSASTDGDYSCLRTSARPRRASTGAELTMIAVSASLMTVRVAHGGSTCLNQNGLKSWSLVVERVASYSRGIWRERGDGLPSWSAGGSGAPVPTSAACPARMRFGARRLHIWCT